MKDQGEIKRLLVALDGSDAAFETIRYLKGFTSFKDMDIVLLSVFSRVSDHYWDIERASPYTSRLKAVRALETHQERGRDAYLQEAKALLLKAGFQDTRIRISLQERQEGITRDILKEARKGYSGLVMGRKGAGGLAELVLGSVASRVLEKLHEVPVALVGKRARGNRFLLPVDGSANALRAVRFAASLLCGKTCEIELIHVVRATEQEDISESEKRIAEVFDTCKEELVALGIPLEGIATQVLVHEGSRAGAIVREANQGRFGTLVMGRRGLSERKEFLMGRVSFKCVQLAGHQAVWIVD